MNSNPIKNQNNLCVCISDIHFNINNLDLATSALKSAIDKATELEVPLVIAGDLNDTKAIIRAEVANRLIQVIRAAERGIYILVGNHDLINEKGEENSLNFLSPYAFIINKPTRVSSYSTTKMLLVPYQTNLEIFKSDLTNITPGSIVIMHQGFLGAAMGDYIQDKSSIDPELVKNLTVISGHYHRHQTLGTVTYIGSPFTHSFGEANDGPKGFLIIKEDGSFDREILDLRKHIIIETTTETYTSIQPQRPQDIIWVKIKGPSSQLVHIKKSEIAGLLKTNNFKLDLIPDQNIEFVASQNEDLSNTQVLDLLIDTMEETELQKSNLKRTYREILES